MGKVGNAQEGRILAGIRCPPAAQEEVPQPRCPARGEARPRTGTSTRRISRPSSPSLTGGHHALELCPCTDQEETPCRGGDGDKFWIMDATVMLRQH
ncbi:hypothetical protein OPV22_020956 [Ensete ventricosum]|uniref:Uncharacterized protein n=1 Tax=Ensete ventricosum TaxID=4639 RepID=A0AAV8QBR8_ENSVE|nr:hypothetical protein OPV22_020956 [Ensete ventricosum]